MYKIVQTKDEKGEKELCAVPASWEKENLLKWPSKTPKKTLKLLKDPNSVPGGIGWKEIKCEVKKSDLPSFDAANEAIDLLTLLSDTSSSDDAFGETCSWRGVD